MNKEYKVLAVAGYTGYANWFPFNVKFVNTVEEAEIVLFEGGEDVHPSLYNDEQHRTTYTSLARDNREVPIYKKAIELGKKIVGVCRGSQLTCVMAGGKLVQDQNNPGIHPMLTADGNVINVTSTHHQAQYPFNLPQEDYKIIGYTSGMLKYHKNGKDEELNPEKECEVVYYPKINALGIQPHPEMTWNDFNNKPKDGWEESIAWFQNVLKEFLEK